MLLGSRFNLGQLLIGGSVSLDSRRESYSLGCCLRILYDLIYGQSRISASRELESVVPSFGEKLKKEREKKKITIEEISASTKIGTRMLQALEENKFNQLPGGIFNKGFVRSYARFVGLDEDQTVAEYLQASGDALPPSTEIAPREGDGRGNGARAKAENEARLESISENPARPLPWGLFAAILLLVALALSLWSRHTRDRAKPAVPPTPAMEVAPQAGMNEGSDSGTGRGGSGQNYGLDAGSRAPTAASLKSTISGPGQVGGGLAGQGAASSSSSSNPAVNVSSSPKNQSKPASSSSSNLAANDPAANLAPGEFSVVVQAKEESWLSIRADGKTAPSELLPAGSERAVRGRREIVVKLGNAGGVDLRFNGKRVDEGGEFGEVKTITFGPHGVIPSAPVALTNP